jgi:TRAP-type C4-dicarboxylate transport system permease small subunit
MSASPRQIGKWLRRRAENVSVILLMTVFISFILQIVFRYILGWPLGWTSEVSTLAWVWLILWGAAFVVSEPDEIRFDILYSVVSDRTRRAFAVVTGVALVLLFGVSLPAVVDYVMFMRVERASYIGVRLDYLFSVYIIFAVAAIVRYVWLGWKAVRGEAPEVTDPARLRDE